MASSNDPDDWAAHPIGGVPEGAPAALAERSADRIRREERDRRRRVWWSLVYGSFNPRRRRAPRRVEDATYHSIDWHASHLLAVAICILLLSVCDAGLTLMLIEAGAEEANPVMALVVGGDSMLFAILKMTMTGLSVILMVYLARYRFMRRVRVEYALYAILLAYGTLIVYEIWMLHARGLSLPF